MLFFWKKENIVTKTESLDLESGSMLKISRLQRLMTYLRTFSHILFIAHHILSVVTGSMVCSDAVKNGPKRIVDSCNHGPVFATNWNFSFQAVFLILAFIHDIYEWRDAQESPRAKKIAYWRDVIFQSMVVPYTLFVSSMFWSLYLYDRELVFPKVYDVILPWWFNHCVHTNITIIVAVETVLQARRHPVNIKLELILTTVINVAYAVVYYSIYFFAHRWLYNIFGVLNWWQVILYQIGIWSSAYFFYYIQFPINRLFHGSEPEVEKTVEVRDAVEKTPEVETKVGSDIAKNFEIASMQKTESDTPFSSENWSLKYRSLREKFENSRL